MSIEESKSPASLRDFWEALAEQAEQDEKLLRDALYALEYAADMTKPEGMSGCGCPICTSIVAIEKRLGEGK